MPANKDKSEKGIDEAGNCIDKGVVPFADYIIIRLY
jgi:hypothetical protein